MPPRVFLLLGIVSSALYVGSDALIAAWSPVYSYLHQTVSELSAIGATTRPWWIATTLVYSPLLLAFGWGVWLSAGARRKLRPVAMLLAVLAVMGAPWAVLAPMHQRGEPTSLTDTLHILLAGMQVVLSLTALVLSALALGGRFRLASFALGAAMLGAGGLASLEGPRVAANLPTPWLGLVERISVYAYLVWIAMLAARLLAEHPVHHTNTAGRRHGARQPG
jgi:hypothetical protein